MKGRREEKRKGERGEEEGEVNGVGGGGRYRVYCITVLMNFWPSLPEL